MKINLSKVLALLLFSLLPAAYSLDIYPSSGWVGTNLLKQTNAAGVWAVLGGSPGGSAVDTNQFVNTNAWHQFTNGLGAGAFAPAYTLPGAVANWGSFNTNVMGTFVTNGANPSFGSVDAATITAVSFTQTNTATGANVAIDTNGNLIVSGAVTATNPANIFSGDGRSLTNTPGNPFFSDNGSTAQIGPGADGSLYGLAFGQNASGWNGGVGIGQGANGAYNGIAIGRYIYALNQGVGIGGPANNFGVAVGFSASANTGGSSIGHHANAENYGLAIGCGAIGANTNIAIGFEASASGGDAIAIGYRATNSTPNSVLLKGDVRTTGIVYATNGCALKSPNGTVYYLHVDDSGNLSTSTSP